MWHRRCLRLIGDLASAGEDGGDCGEKVHCIIETAVGMRTLTDTSTSLRVTPSLLGIGPGASLCGCPRASTASLPAPTTSPRQAHFRPALFFPFLSRLAHTYIRNCSMRSVVDTQGEFSISFLSRIHASLVAADR